MVGRWLLVVGGQAGVASLYGADTGAAAQLRKHVALGNFASRGPGGAGLRSKTTLLKIVILSEA